MIEQLGFVANLSHKPIEGQLFLFVLLENRKKAVVTTARENHATAEKSSPLAFGTRRFRCTWLMLEPRPVLAIPVCAENPKTLLVPHLQLSYNYQCQQRRKSKRYREFRGDAMPGGRIRRGFRSDVSAGAGSTRSNCPRSVEYARWNRAREWLRRCTNWFGSTIVLW